MSQDILHLLIKSGLLLHGNFVVLTPLQWRGLEDVHCIILNASFTRQDVLTLHQASHELIKLRAWVHHSES